MSQHSLTVLQVNKLYVPSVGGIETVVRNIAEELATNGVDSRVLAAVPRGPGKCETRNGVTVRKVSSVGTAQSVPLAPTFPARLWQDSRNIDIVHHHLPNPLSVVAHQVTPSRPRPTVVTYHSDIVRQQTSLRLYEPLLQSFLRDVNRILVTSPRLLDNSRFLQPHTEKCTVVPLSLDLTDYTDPPADARLPVADDDRPLLLFVGRLNYYKGVEYLIDAMTDIDATLLIVGDGERRSTLEARATERGVTNKVTFAGHVPTNVLHRCYAEAELFVLPSVEPSEAFGIVQLEAMAYETPVVNTDLPTGVPWVSRDGETGLTVPPRNSGALADAIRTLLADDERRRVYGKAARERVQAEFSREQMLTRLESVYTELLE